MSWNILVPANDGLLINAPGQIRANWDALKLMTDSDLLITNAKCAAGMGLVDTKLAQITTPGKISGAAITLLTNIPVGAGTLPLANIPSTLTGKSADQLDAQEGSYYRNATNINAGLLKHEYGGIQADISAIVKGGILVGTGAGVMGIKAAGTDGHFIKYNSSVAGGIEGAAISNIELFISDGVFTAPAGKTKVYITMVGGGGGAGAQNTGVGSQSGGGGGGGAGLTFHPYTVVAGNDYTIQVGLGGAGGGGNAQSGVDGEASIFDSGGGALTVNGGVKGLANGTGGSGGNGNSDFDAPGSNGGTGIFKRSGGDGSNFNGGGGGGGGSLFGDGANGSNSGNGSSAIDGSGGGGGGGKQASGNTGGDGGDGLVIVMY